MSLLSSRTQRASRLPIAVLGVSLLVAAAGQLAGPTTRVEPEADTSSGDALTADASLDQISAFGPSDIGGGELERIRANVAFWSDRSAANPGDFVSSTRWAAAEIDLARATGDVTRYLAAGEALELALGAHADYRPAIGYRGVVLVALHDFESAAEHARTVLASAPGDPVALATLGDASIATGDMDTARGAYEQLSLVADSAAARVRRANLAFIDGDPAGALVASQSALEAAIDEGAEGASLAWYRYQLGDVLAATGDVPAAEAAWTEALDDDPGSALARWGLARVAAADGRWDDAIAQLDAAIEIIPSPEFLARRADLLRLRGADGDARREQRDRETVLAIADLAGEAAGVYDRTLSLYLSTVGRDPERALELAESELRTRRDVYGYDALAWALHANGRNADAQVAMTEALSLGTRDAKLLFHAGMIAASLGDDGTARAYLEDALALDPSFDPRSVALARETLESISAGPAR